MRPVVVVLTAVMALAAASSSRADDLRDRAHQEFTTAQGEFDAGHFDVALAHLQRAYALAPHPELLFNIARCLEELHRTGDAVEAYDRYLAVQPNDRVARERVAALRKQGATSPTPPTEPRATPPPPLTEPRATTLTEPRATPSAAMPEATAAGVVTAQPPAARRPLYRRWWLWTAVGGVAVAGLTVGLAVGLTRPSSPPTFPPLTAQ